MPIEYDFGDIDTAIKELKRLRFSLEGPFFEGKYFVVPMDISEDYPRKIDSKKPRPLATVTIHGRLIINEFPDQNRVLIECQERLKEGLAEKIKK
ncbi:MAG: hypothetical protein AABX79_02955 [Nanoarchaeota archaeon]